jgi:phosphatidylglycerol:prolipoprotein diacylglycerol transferase
MLTAPLAEWTYPRIDPILWGPIRWYGVSYILAFGLAFLVLKRLSKQGRWPVHPDRVGDVLFWGILGVFLGGRIGYMIGYAPDKSFPAWFQIRDGGMSFHGGLGGVVVAYLAYALRRKIRFRDLLDGLALATVPGIFVVRLANFVNAELVGRVWDGPWAMRFPKYVIGHEETFTWDTVTRHPSQLYQALGEGLLHFLILRWLMIGRGWGGGFVQAAFLVLYGALRFGAEFFRDPDPQLGYEWLGLTRGQEYCLLMVGIGLVAFVALRAVRSRPMVPIDWTKVGPDDPIPPHTMASNPPPPVAPTVG